MRPGTEPGAEEEGKGGEGQSQPGKRREEAGERWGGQGRGEVGGLQGGLGSDFKWMEGSKGLNGSWGHMGAQLRHPAAPTVVQAGTGETEASPKTHLGAYSGLSPTTRR